MDSINITGISAYGYTGLLPEEQKLGQWFKVDLTLLVDLATPGKSDGIEDTFDYRNAISLVQSLIKDSKFALIEKLAAIIAEEILKLGKVEQVRVQLSKPNAPIPNFSGNIQVDITRSKS